MEELLAFSTHRKDLELTKEGQLLPLLREFELCGLELLPLGEIPQDLREIVVGVHLPFQPVWLPFWFGEHSYLKEIFPGEENLNRFFGGTQRGDFVLRVKGWLENALQLNPRYVIFHVSHCGLEEVFSLSFRYESKVVLLAVAELLNEVFACLEAHLGETLICFENLWWPGLTFLEAWEIDFFFLHLNLPSSQLALALDTGHLLNASYLLKRPCSASGPVPPAQALSLIQEVLLSLPPEARRLIRVVHLNFSPNHWLFTPDQVGLKALLSERDPLKRWHLARRRVLKMDPHLPFEGVDLRPLIEFLAPDYLVHELRFENHQDLREKLFRQRRSLS